MKRLDNVDIFSADLLLEEQLKVTITPVCNSLQNDADDLANDLANGLSRDIA